MRLHSFPTRRSSDLSRKPRDRYVISTKVGRRLAVTAPPDRSGIGKFFDTPSRREVFDYSYDGIMRSVEDSLERLGLDRIDVLFVHDLDVFTHGSTMARDAQVEAFMRNEPIDFVGVNYDVGSRKAEETILPLAQERKDRKSTRLNSSHSLTSRMPSSA